MTTNNPIADVLAAPLAPGWTVEGIAEQVLTAIATPRSEDALEFVIDAGTIGNSQARRLLRPLLACLAAKSAAETGTSTDLYGGRLSFRRSDPNGPVWIVGQFDNRPGLVRLSLRRSNSPPADLEAKPGQPAVLTDSDSSSIQEIRDSYP